MANFLKRFNKEVIGSGKRIYDYLPKVSAIGDFKRIRDIDVIISSWNTILKTPRRTYLHDPEFGSDLHKLIFDPVDDTTIDRIRTEVETRIRMYDDRATIEDVAIKLLPNNKGYALEILVKYQGETGTLSVSFDGTTLA